LNKARTGEIIYKLSNGTDTVMFLKYTMTESHKFCKKMLDYSQLPVSGFF